ncbi:MAG: ribosome small subunit-dependent GTPase A [Clostridiales bacterium]|nr:ribosome small subunit-dependent GTPase A [Clostridiales bacterium]
MTKYQGIISAQHRGAFRVWLPQENREISAALSGSLRRLLAKQDTAPVTGDRVTLDRQSDAAGAALILSLLPRTSLMSRTEAGLRGRSQPLAANIDLALICTSMNEEFNPKRLDRYLAMADGAGVRAVLLLTKADLAPDPQPWLAPVLALRPPRSMILCSAYTGRGMDELRQLLHGRRAVLLGSSGVGKSSLINALLGDERMRTAHISVHQDKGRHTTTSRQLIPLPGGGYLIDTPGMRELKLDQSDADAAFADITALAAQCRFGDCRHGGEPGCAVRAAVEAGTLSAARLNSWRKLSREQEMRARRR